MSMVEVAAELTRDEDLQRSIAICSLKERRRLYAENKKIVGFCQSCWDLLYTKAGLCGECQALATKGWLEPAE
jgi:hypothetical protein